MPDVQFDPNSIIGPVIPAQGWKVRNGWGFEIYTRLNGVVGSHIPLCIEARARPSERGGN